MNRIIVYFLAVVLLLAINATMPFFRQSAPNLLFLLVIFMAFRQDSVDFLWVAFFAGLILDVYSAPIFGSYLFSFLILAMIVNTTTRTFFSADPNLIYIATVIVISYLMLVGMIYILNALAFQFHNIVEPLSPLYLSQKIWFDLILNLIFAMPVYFLTQYLDQISLYFTRKEHV